MLRVAHPARDLPGELNRAVTIETLQPPAELIGRIERRVRPGDEGVRHPRDFSREEMPGGSMPMLMLENVPYYHYHSLKDDEQHVVHPMRLGRFLFRNVDATIVDDYLKAALSLAHELPNGGLAWYYPRHYNNARMLGENLKYSAISQGTLISGFTALAQRDRHLGAGLAKKAFDALRWPFEKGGVNLADRAVLEMPFFSAPPEIILNGWIDALLHVRDYALVMEDHEAQDFFRRNVAFLTSVLPNFDSREAGVSRYSDLCPYRVKATLARAGDVDTLQVLYRPLIDGLPAIRVPLARTRDPDNFSIYENQIVRQTGRSALLWLSCSQIYETVLVSRSRSMTVQLKRGTIDRNRTTPAIDGETITLKGERQGDLCFVSFGGVKGLIRGYPTNFVKYQVENFYHSYHVVSLLLLATGELVDAEQRATMLDWALRWHDDMKRIEAAEGLGFRDPQQLLAQLNAGQLLVAHRDFDAMLGRAREMAARGGD